MAAGDVGVGTQPALEIVATDVPEERIVRVLRHATRLRGQVRGKRKQRDRRVVTRSEEQRAEKGRGQGGRSRTRQTARKDEVSHVLNVASIRDA